MISIRGETWSHLSFGNLTLMVVSKIDVIRKINKRL